MVIVRSLESASRASQAPLAAKVSMPATNAAGSQRGGAARSAPAAPGKRCLAANARTALPIQRSKDSRIHARAEKSADGADDGPQQEQHSERNRQ